MQNLDSTSVHQPRQPWFALLMSLVLPGFGQLYNGQINKGIYLFLGFAVLLIPAVVFMALYLPVAWVVPVGAAGCAGAFVLWIYGMVDAWRTARQSAQYTLRSWQLGSVYLLVFLLCNLLALPLLIDYVRTHQVASYRIPSGSMEPGVLAGDILFADKRYNCPNCASPVARGDVAIFTYPNNRTQNYIKRVIALPGDRVQIKGHRVSVNGTPLTTEETPAPQGVLVTERIDARSWQVQWSAIDTAPTDIDMTVPPGHAFVLSDNRSTSRDSREFGTVPLQDILGKALQIWFSRSQADGVRWQRMGMVVR